VSTDALNQIRGRLTQTFRAYLDASERGPERAIAVKKAAELLADARELFYDSDGNADLMGRSYDYRMFVGGALDEAGVPKDERNALTSAIRFHISPIMHERHGEELASRGLDSGSTRDRARARRKQEAAVTRLFGGGAPITDVEDILRLTDLITGALARVRAPDEDFGAVSEALHRVVVAASDAQKRVALDARLPPAS